MAYKRAEELRQSYEKLNRILDLLQDEITVINLIPYAQSDGAKEALWQLKKLLSHNRRLLK